MDSFLPEDWIIMFLGTGSGMTIVHGLNRFVHNNSWDSSQGVNLYISEVGDHVSWHDKMYVLTSELNLLKKNRKKVTLLFLSSVCS